MPKFNRWTGTVHLGFSIVKSSTLPIRNACLRFLHFFDGRVGQLSPLLEEFTPMARLFQPQRSHAILARAAACGLALAVTAVSASSASAQDLIVKYDQASIVRLSRPAAEIIVGNPSITDVSIQSGTSLVITGKSFGITNIIALDSQGQVIRDQRVMVRVDDDRMVVVNSGGKRNSFACTPTCAPTLTVGDDNDFFTKTQGTVTAKAKTSESAGDGGAGAQ
jgi:Flp pilus assembly secretin CpaC